MISSKSVIAFSQSSVGWVRLTMPALLISTSNGPDVVDEPSDVVRVGHVSGDVTGLCPHVAHGHPRAGVDERVGDGPTDALRATGDQRPATGQAHVP